MTVIPTEYIDKYRDLKFNPRKLQEYNSSDNIDTNIKFSTAWLEEAKYNGFYEQFMKDQRSRLYKDVATRILEKIVDNGPYGIEATSYFYADIDAYGYTPDTIIMGLSVKLMKATSVRQKYIEPAPPRVDLLAAMEGKAKKRVFFCPSCGTPHFWGDRSCQSCGSPLDYERSKEFINDF